MDANQANKQLSQAWNHHHHHHHLDHQNPILGSQNLHNQPPFSPIYPLQHHQSPPSCPNIPTTNVPSILGEQLLGTQQEKEQEPEEELGAMKEMMYRIAAMQPVDIDPATIRRPRRRNVRISDDPQSVAARHRRERISEKIRILQRLVPGGTKLDTASMLDEAICYVKFLKRQIRILQANPAPTPVGEQHHQYWQVSYDNNKPLSSTSTWN